MKRKRSIEHNDNLTYTSTVLHSSVRECLTDLYIAWKAQGNKRKEFLDLLDQAGYNVPPRTLSNWVSQKRSTGAALSNDKETGREKLLTEEQQKLICGYVLDRNNKNKEVHLYTVSNFISNNFNIKISNSTILRYLHQLGFSNRAMQTKKYGFSIDQDKLVDIAYLWLTEYKNNAIFTTPRRQLCSIDFTYTGHRTDRRTTYSKPGTAQPRSGKSRSSYTNCIVTCIWADGCNRTPSILYTYNQKFRTDRKQTEKRKVQVEHLTSTLKKYNINKSRVIYFGKQAKENRNYVSESPAIIRSFFQHHEVQSNCTVLSDEGGAFYEGSEDILLGLGFNKHITYPSVVHQFLSPNDNRFHGSAKQIWRSMQVDYKDDVESSIALLHCLDQCNHNSHSWFDKNLQINELDPTQENMKLLINGQDEKNNDFYEDCIDEFRLFQQNDGYYCDNDD